MLTGHGDDTYRYKDIRINFSSNIYPHADLTALEQHLCRNIDCIRSYPEPSPRSLEAMIARKYGIEAEEVMVTSGATDAIYLIAQAMRRLKTYHVIHPTFAEYDDACRMFGYEEKEAGASLCWLCNPNNPTGRVLTEDSLLNLSQQFELMVVDQSYEDYTLLHLPQPDEMLRHGNIVQIHSMTKQYAIPGLRLGYITGPSSIIQNLRQHGRPWAVNTLAIEAGKWLVAGSEKFIADIQSYIDETQRLRNRLNTIEGIAALPTQTTFFLCTIQGATAAELKTHLATKHGILIRDASNFRSLTPHHFRIATQTPAENDALVDAISQFIQQR